MSALDARPSDARVKTTLSSLLRERSSFSRWTRLVWLRCGQVITMDMLVTGPCPTMEGDTRLEGLLL